ncbi:MAG TPA: LptF/LptG family permease [Gemmatimonadaceae bacterium]
MKILTRYILREHLGPLAFASAALTALLLLNQVAKQFGSLVGKGLGWGVIGEVFYLSVPFIIAMTLPMAVLVAVLYAFSRLASENEVTALRASGVSMVKLVRPVLWGGAVLALLMLLFNDQVLPRANHRLRTLETDIARKKPTFALHEQVINEVIPGKIFLKPGHIDEATNRLREVFIYNFEDPTRRKTIYADSGHMGLTRDQTTLQMTLHHGYVLEVPRDDPGTLQRLYFTTDLVRVRGVANEFEKTEKDSYKSEREMTVCEMSNQYEQGAQQLQVARHDLASTLGNAAYAAATGERRPVAEPVRTSTPPSSGALYCDLVSRVFGNVATAEAAEPPAAPRARQGTTSKPAPEPSAATPAKPAAKTPAAKPVATQPPGLPSLGQQYVRQHAAPRRAAPKKPAAATVQHPESARATKRRVNPDSLLHALPPGVRRPGAESVLLQPGGAARYVPPNPASRITLPSPGQLDVLRARITDARTTMNRYEVEIQKKFALAAACIVFVIFGAPIALRFPRGGVGLVIGVSLVAFSLYYVCLIAGETLADKLILSPFWAMWMANVVFAVVGVVLLARVQRTGPAARGGDAAEMWETIRTRFARLLRRVGIPADRRAA